jgi:hypothetical protein
MYFALDGSPRESNRARRDTLLAEKDDYLGSGVLAGDRIGDLPQDEVA